MELRKDYIIECSPGGEGGAEIHSQPLYTSLCVIHLALHNITLDAFTLLGYVGLAI